jgi:type IVB pilus formation R64 PilN family outer membrane protein
MRGNTVRVLSTAIAMVLLLEGCWVRKRDIDQAVGDTNARITTEMGRSGKQSPALVVREGRWLAGREIPMDTPTAPELHQRVRLASATPASLGEIAQRLTQITHIPVSLEPDLTSASTTGSSSGGNGNSSTLPQLPSPTSLGLPALPNLPLPSGVSSGADLGSVDNSEPISMRVAYSHDGPLDEFLNQITGRFGIAWEYKAGRIVLSRFQTKTFVLHLPADVRTVEAEVGGQAMAQEQAQTAITSGGQNSSGSAANSGTTATPQTNDGIHQKVTTSATLDTWKEVNESLPRLLSPAGHFATAPSSGEIVVTDTPAALKRVADYVEQKNANLTRQVAIQVDVLSIDDTKGDNFEIDWNMIFQNADLGLALVTPTAIQGAASNLAMQILRPTSDFRGTSMVIKAMSTYLNSRLVTTSVATTLNNHPAPIQVTRTDGYLRSIQSNVTGVNAVVSTSLVPGQITTGFVMTVTPRFLDLNRLMLTYNIDLSRLLNFTTASVGSGDNAASIQIPNFERRAFMQAVAVKAGDTLVLSGFEQADDKADLEAPLHPENTLFGSRQMQRHRSRIVILLTPVIVGNGAA